MQMIKVGNITNTHGIKGELKVQATGIENFDRDIYYYIGEEYNKINITNSKIHKNIYIIKIKGFDNINDVLKFKGKSIYIEESDILDLTEDEYYIMDLVGLQVYENDKLIGELVDVFEYEVNDVYIVDTNEKQILIPAVDEFILNIDLENNRLDVKLIEGM